MRELSERERRFVLALTGPALGNITRAAEIAGYATKSAARSGHRLTKRPHVRQALQARHGAQERRADIRDDRILKEVADIAYAALEGQAIKPADKLRALELLAKHKGLLQTESPESSRITVHIGYLQTGTAPTLEPVVDMPALPALDGDITE